MIRAQTLLGPKVCIDFYVLITYIFEKKKINSERTIILVTQENVSLSSLSSVLQN